MLDRVQSRGSPRSPFPPSPVFLTSTLATVVLNYRLPVCPCSPKNRQNHPPPLPTPHPQRVEWAMETDTFPRGPVVTLPGLRDLGTWGFKNRLLREKKV